MIPVSTNDSVSSGISFPFSSRTPSSLAAHSIRVVLMNSVSLARCLPTQIHRPHPNETRPACIVFSGSDGNSPRSSMLAEIHPHLRRIRRGHDCRTRCSAFRNEHAFIPVVVSRDVGDAKWYAMTPAKDLFDNCSYVRKTRSVIKGRIHTAHKLIALRNDDTFTAQVFRQLPGSYSKTPS